MRSLRKTTGGDRSPDTSIATNPRTMLKNSLMESFGKPKLPESLIQTMP